MNEERYRVDYFLLSDEFKEPGVGGGRVSYCIKGPQSREAHENYVKEQISLIEAEGEDHYVSYRQTSQVYKNFDGMPPYHVTVVHFRIRDSY